MKTNIIILLIFLLINSATAEYQEQELKPLKMRILAPKQKSYPVLEALESELYPQKNFSKEAPQKRLERIEIATFGEIQSGGIKERIDNLKIELQNWQIAKVQVTPAVTPKSQLMNPSRSHLTHSRQTQYQKAFQYTRNRNQSIKQPNYEYLNYRIASPLVQNLGRKGIEKIFKDKK
ncbi:MAG: hypothetical protein RLZZ361_599 [Cyanobacteriota bacterium]|jgi:hypothetical protein